MSNDLRTKRKPLGGASIEKKKIEVSRGHQRIGMCTLCQGGMAVPPPPNFHGKSARGALP